MYIFGGGAVGAWGSTEWHYVILCDVRDQIQDNHVQGMQHLNTYTIALALK